MTLHPQTSIGHVHLTVADIDRSLAFYRDILGFEVTTTYGDSAVFLSAGGYHHHIGLNTWKGEGVPPPPPRTKVLQRLIDANYPLDGASDHGVSEALYLRDPDSIGVELYCDRPREEWKYIDGKIVMVTEALDLEDLLTELTR